MTALWHPFADMAAVEREELTLVRGEGVFVWDDAAAATSTAPRASGTRTSATAAARSPTPIARQMAELETFHVFGDLANRPRANWPSASPNWRRSRARRSS